MGTKWEYNTYTIDPERFKRVDAGNVNAGLNGYGEEGWELVNIIVQPNGYYLALMKRPKP